MVALPAAEQLAATDEIVGVAGTVNCAALLNEAETDDIQIPFDAETV